MMTGWTLFLILIGVAFLTAQLFRIVDAIERPTRHWPPEDPQLLMDVLDKLTILTDAAKYDAA